MLVADLKLELSMSRAGTPTDNPFAERFVKTFKHSVIKKRPYLTLNDFLDAALKWINLYHEKRPHESLNMKTPNQYAEKIGQELVLIKSVFRVQ